MVNALLTKDPNKLNVLIGENVYDLELNGNIHRISSNTVINYDGKEIKGEELYELLNC